MSNLSQMKQPSAESSHNLYATSYNYNGISGALTLKVYTRFWQFTSQTDPTDDLYN